MVSDNDLQRCLDTIVALRSKALELLQLQESALRDLRNGSTTAKPAGSSTPTDEEIRYATEQSQLFSQATQLRSHYRRAIMSTRTTKQTTSDARAEVDSLHLQLQNLIYEQRHLKGEIAACEGYEYVVVISSSRELSMLIVYSHKYTSLPLIPKDEFLSLFPDKSDLSEHELMIARVEHERAERQALEEKRQGLLKRKQGLIAENNRRKEDLANLDKDLEKFIDAADPIIKTFEKEY